MKENSIHNVIESLHCLPQEFQKNHINVLTELFDLLDHLRTAYDSYFGIPKASTQFLSKLEKNSEKSINPIQSNAEAQKLQEDLLKYLRRTRSSIVKINQNKILEDL